MDETLLLVCALEACGELESINNRNLWVHPFIRDKPYEFQTFYGHIRNNDSEFFGYYRMSIKSFDELLGLVRPYITKQNTIMRQSISAEERLTITLR